MPARNSRLIIAQKPGNLRAFSISVSLVEGTAGQRPASKIGSSSNGTNRLNSATIVIFAGSVVEDLHVGKHSRKTLLTSLSFFPKISERTVAPR
jgi:hypothetical protein